MVRQAVGALMLVACGRIGFAPLSDGSGGSDTGTHSPPAFVQFNDSSGGAGTVAVDYVTPVTAQDLLVVTVGFNTPTASLSSVTDTTGDTFTVLPKLMDATDGRYVAYAMANTSAVETVTFVVTGAGAVIGRVHEYTGVNPMHPLDTFATNTGTACGTDASTVQITTAYDHELVFAYAGSQGTASAGTGFMQHSTLSNGVTEDRVVPTAGAQTVTATCTSAPWTIEALALIGV